MLDCAVRKLAPDLIVFLPDFLFSRMCGPVHSDGAEIFQSYFDRTIASTQSHVKVDAQARHGSAVGVVFGAGRKRRQTALGGIESAG